MSEPAHYDVLPVPAFKDNYIWVLRNETHAAVVDPGDAQPVLAYLSRERLRLAAILTTHHHADHVGGVAALIEQHPVPVFGPKGEPIATLTHSLGDGDRVDIPEVAARFHVIAIPGHTRAHIAYYGATNLFCGDTLFACGCGRVFEGTAQQMHASLARLSALPDDTLVYCGHEYTLANIRFARAVEPGNAALGQRERVESHTRQEGRPTLPSSIGKEKETNPFLRCNEPEVIASAGRYLGKSISDPVQVFAAIRNWKNEF